MNPGFGERDRRSTAESRCLASAISPSFVVKTFYFDNTSLKAFLLVAFRASGLPIYTADPWHFCCHFCIMNDNDLVLLSQHFGERSMDNFQFITIEATESSKGYTATIQIRHIVSIISAKDTSGKPQRDNLHAIHLVNGQKIWVEKTYEEILSIIKNCVSFPVVG